MVPWDHSNSIDQLDQSTDFRINSFQTKSVQTIQISHFRFRAESFPTESNSLTETHPVRHSTQKEGETSINKKNLQYFRSIIQLMQNILEGNIFLVHFLC
jgi:hypothetical protein